MNKPPGVEIGCLTALYPGSMTIWDLRDKALEALHELNNEAPSAAMIHTHLQDPNLSVDDVQKALNWLEKRGFVNAVSKDVTKALISDRGENAVEMDWSVRDLIEKEMQGISTSVQNNINIGPSANIAGNSNTAYQQNSPQSPREQ